MRSAGLDLSMMGGGARPIALGKAFSAVSGDPNSLFINPAGISGMDTFEITSMYANFSSDVKYTMVAVAAPSDLGVVGMGYVGDSITGLVHTTVEATGRISSLSQFDTGSGVLLLSYGRMLEDDIHIGCNLKLFNSGSAQIDGGSGSGTSLDIGILYEMTPDMNIGISFQNIVNSGMKWSGGVIDPIVPDFRVGMAYKPLSNINILIDGEVPQGSPLLLKGGAEWWIQKNLAIRGGAEQFALNTSEKYMNFSAGVGFGIGDVTIDYAYYYQSLFPSDSTHFVSVSVMLPTIRFGSQKRKNDAEKKLLSDAEKNYQGGNFPEAMHDIKEVLIKSPKNDRANSLLDKIENGMGTSTSAATTQITAAQKLTIRERLAKALNYFYLGEYFLAIEECQKVLSIDPKNMTALKRLGSTYYIMGKRDEAIKTWEKASALDPNDKKIREYLDYLESNDDTDDSDD